jgi:hypothetical protein
MRSRYWRYEMPGEYDKYTDAAKGYKEHLDNHAPAWFMHGVNTILYHPGTPYFFLGMGVEAIGLSVQFFFQGSSYPIFDAIISFLLGYMIMYYHMRKKNVQPNTNKNP